MLCEAFQLQQRDVARFVANRSEDPVIIATQQRMASSHRAAVSLFDTVPACGRWTDRYHNTD